MTDYNVHPTYTQRGFSFIEVLVAISILLVAIVGPMTIASDGLQISHLARERAVAVFLAQEGLEGVYYFQGNAGLDVLRTPSTNTWAWVNSSIPAGCTNGAGQSCRLDTTGSEPVYEVCNDAEDCRVYYQEGAAVPYRQGSTSGNATRYIREITFDTSGNQLKVYSKVRWDTRVSQSEQDVELTAYLYDIYETED